MAMMMIPKILQGPEELSVEGPKVLFTFDLLGLKINFTETISSGLSWQLYWG